MAARPARVSQTEITRTLKAAAEAGVDVDSFVVNHDTGEVTVVLKGAIQSRGAAEIDRMLGIS